MGGGGAIQDMINSVRNNRALLRKTTIFEGPKHNYAYAKALYEKKKRLLKFKDATPEQLAIIREEIKQDQKRKTLKAITASLLLVALIFLGVSIGVMEYRKQRNLETLKKEAITEEAHLRQFVLFSEKADHLYKKQDWDKAAYTYRLALNLKPNHYQTELKLARVLYFNCLYKGKDCFNAMDLTDKLLNQHPNNPVLQKMKVRFDRGF